MMMRELSHRCEQTETSIWRDAQDNPPTTLSVAAFVSSETLHRQILQGKFKNAKRMMLVETRRSSNVSIGVSDDSFFHLVTYHDNDDLNLGEVGLDFLCSFSKNVLNKFRTWQ